MIILVIERMECYPTGNKIFDTTQVVEEAVKKNLKRSMSSQRIFQVPFLPPHFLKNWLSPLGQP